jgi:hypothetical protein
MTTPHPSAWLNKWLRDHPRANVAHRILHYSGSELQAYCGRTFPADKASDKGGVILCAKCLALSQARKQSPQKAQSIRRKPS